MTRGDERIRDAAALRRGAEHIVDNIERMQAPELAARIGPLVQQMNRFIEGRTGQPCTIEGGKLLCRDELERLGLLHARSLVGTIANTILVELQRCHEDSPGPATIDRQRRILRAMGDFTRRQKKRRRH